MIPAVSIIKFVLITVHTRHVIYLNQGHFILVKRLDFLDPNALVKFVVIGEYPSLDKRSCLIMLIGHIWSHVPEIIYTLFV